MCVYMYVCIDDELRTASRIENGAGTGSYMCVNIIYLCMYKDELDDHETLSRALHPESSRELARAVICV